MGRDVEDKALASRTFRTNNVAITLFAVLAEVDGTGVPLADCFMDTFKDNNKGNRHADPGAIILKISKLNRLYEMHMRDSGQT
jgi:hypothetical protein